jgi:multidrug resistance protein MdtO
MAVSVPDSSGGHFRKWLDLLAPTEGRWEFAARVALCCALVVLITEIYRTPFASLAAFMVFCLNRPDRTTTVINCVVFMIAGTFCIAILFLLALLVINDPMWRVIAMAVTSFAVLFVSSASKLRRLGATLASAIGYGLDLLGSVQSANEATHGFLYVLLAIAIAAAVSFVVNLALGPAPRRLAGKAIAHRLRVSAGVLRHPEPLLILRFREYLYSGVGPVLALLGLARLERSASSTDLAALHQAALSSMTLMSAIDVLQSAPDAKLPNSTRAELADTLERMAAVFSRGAYSVGVALVLPPEAEQLSPLASSVLAEIRQALRRFADPNGKIPVHPKQKAGFFAKDALTNPGYARYALKTTAAAMFCYFLFNILNWPGIHTCFFTVFLVSQATAGESVEKLSLRILGCLIGAAAGIGAIVFLIPSLTSIGGLLLTVFVGGLGAAYVLGGGPRISYAGLQIALAFLLSVIEGYGPGFNMVPARDRIIGILIGNLVAYLMFVKLSPVSICRRIDPAIAASWKRLAAMLSESEFNGRSLLASEAQSALREAAADIEVSHYEPRSVRPDAGWLSARRRAAQESQTLSTLLLLGTDQRALSATGVGARLEALGLQLQGQDQARETAPPSSGASPVQALIDKSLLRLEQLLTGDNPNLEQAARARA